MAKILVTGAGGYVGKRLIPFLIEKTSHTIVALVRSKERFEIQAPWKGRIEVIEGDLLFPQTLENIPHDIGIAYYLVHSMSHSKTDFAELEARSAENFLQALEKTSCRQIIYLSGLVSDKSLSPHLKSRLAVEKILQSGKIPCTTLRAGIIIGSGSASFEIIRDLVEKLPLMVAPKWVNNRCQPISIYDVIWYLTNVIDNPGAVGKVFDIGGPDQLTYRQMLLEFARLRGLKRIVITVPVLTPRLSSWWLYFVTSTNFNLAQTLVDSLKSEAVCHDNSIEKILPHSCFNYREALERVFSKIDQNAVLSSWKDALIQSRLNPKLKVYIQVPHEGCLVDEQTVSFTISKNRVTDSLWRIGGKRGWYAYQFAWNLRGFIDKVFGGVGLSRGRRDSENLQTGDTLDFWRVLLADRQNGHLLLYAEMRLPGEAWLEWRVNDHLLVQRATFRPKGVLGRLYWYILYPFHILIFKKMARQIVLRA